MPQLPPQHSVDESQVDIIPGESDAWDRVRIEDELGRMGEHTEEHPFIRYFSGYDRFSLEAPYTFKLTPKLDPEAPPPAEDAPEPEPEIVTACAGDYLVEQACERWTIRRIDELEYARKVLPHFRRGDLEEAYIQAVSRGLVKCENGPKLDCNKSGKTDATMNDVRTVIREGHLSLIGNAIIMLSRPLTEAEKKRFASSRGRTPRS